jgi:hypothetical protein
MKQIKTKSDLYGMITMHANPQQQLFSSPPEWQGADSRHATVDTVDKEFRCLWHNRLLDSSACTAVHFTADASACHPQAASPAWCMTYTSSARIRPANKRLSMQMCLRVCSIAVSKSPRHLSGLIAGARSGGVHCAAALLCECHS